MNPRRILKGHSDRVLSLAFSPDSKTLASGGWDNTVKLWDVTTEAAGDSLDDRPSRLGDVRGVQSGRCDFGIGKRNRNHQVVGHRQS